MVKTIYAHSSLTTVVEPNVIEITYRAGASWQADSSTLEYVVNLFYIQFKIKMKKSLIIYQIHLTCMLTITIVDPYLPASPPTIHQMQMRMYISALRMMNVASWVWPGFGQHVIVQEDTDHLSMNIWGMMLQLRLYVIYCICILIIDTI